MKTIKISIYILILSIGNAFAQGTAGYKAPYESREIIEMPTAGVLPKGSYNIKTRLYREGGILLESNVSFLRNLMVGLSYTANKVIGDNDMEFQGIPGINLKYRVLDETLRFPALALGFSNQGNGVWMPEGKRFQIYSPGIYLAASKNFSWALGDISTTLGLNYSFDPPKKDRSVNVYGGLEHTLGKYFSICSELNLSLDDNAPHIPPVNIAVSIKSSIARGVTLELQLRNRLYQGQFMRDATLDRRMSIDIIKYF